MVLGGLTEWLRSRIGNAVRCNSPVGSSPMSSARKRKRQVLTCLFLFLVKYNGMRTHEWVRVSHPHFAQGFACNAKWESVGSLPALIVQWRQVTVGVTYEVRSVVLRQKKKKTGFNPMSLS